jgi:hypothetical protein
MDEGIPNADMAKGPNDMAGESPDVEAAVSHSDMVGQSPSIEVGVNHSSEMRVVIDCSTDHLVAMGLALVNTGGPCLQPA